MTAFELSCSSCRSCCCSCRAPITKGLRRVVTQNQTIGGMSSSVDVSKTSHFRHLPCHTQPPCYYSGLPARAHAPPGGTSVDVGRGPSPAVVDDKGVGHLFSRNPRVSRPGCVCVCARACARIFSPQPNILSRSFVYAVLFVLFSGAPGLNCAETIGSRRS